MQNRPYVCISSQPTSTTRTETTLLPPTTDHQQDRCLERCFAEGEAGPTESRSLTVSSPPTLYPDTVHPSLFCGNVLYLLFVPHGLFFFSKTHSFPWPQPFPNFLNASETHTTHPRWIGPDVQTRGSFFKIQISIPSRLRPKTCPRADWLQLCPRTLNQVGEKSPWLPELI